MLKYHIQTIEVGTTAPSSISFSSIPQTYDDLLLVLSGRANASGQPSILYRFNNSSSGYSGRILAGYTSGVTSGSTSTLNSVNAGGDWGRLDYEGFNYSTSTANTFSNIQFYIPNYKSNNVKTGSADIATEDVSASPLRWWLSIVASLWSGTQPITSVSFALYEGSFAQYSSISLYGIKRGTDGVTGISPLTTGGTIVTSGGYTYHTFTSSGTFVTNRSLVADALIVAGGGGAEGGGGGAGGLLSFTNQAIDAGAYTVTVGSGGARLTNGANSSAFSLIALGGGAGGTFQQASGGSGGSGGGGAGQQGATSAAGGLGTAGQGNNGGNGFVASASALAGGGGGGAGAAGATATTNVGGVGGAGSNAFSAWASATSTGVAGFYAGGGGGGGEGGGGAGGAGGGANGVRAGSNSAAANTGGGGGGSYENQGGSGGSGIVIIRYPTPA